jgi:hypothetical protein
MKWSIGFLSLMADGRRTIAGGRWMLAIALFMQQCAAQRMDIGA